MQSHNLKTPHVVTYGVRVAYARALIFRRFCFIGRKGGNLARFALQLE